MIVFKILLSSLIIVICSYFGISKARNLSRREHLLKDTLTFFNLVENEINYNLTILPNAYEVARQNLSSPIKEVIGQIAVDMLESDNYENCNQSIVNNVNRIDSLTYYDRNIIITTLKNLGRSDLDSQINIIENTKKIINEQIKDAEQIKNKNSKLYKTVGTVVGIMAVIVLI